MKSRVDICLPAFGLTPQRCIPVDAQPDIDAARCPLCGRPTHCQRATRGAYKGPCWCYGEEVPQELIRRIPPEAQGVACVCQACISEFRHARNAALEGAVAQPGDFYFERGLVVFKASYLLRRGYCCGSGCRHCPYPKIADTSPAEPGFDP